MPPRTSCPISGAIRDEADTPKRAPVRLGPVVLPRGHAEDRLDVSFGHADLDQVEVLSVDTVRRRREEWKREKYRNG
jgi:hypothetical protein